MKTLTISGKCVTLDDEDLERVLKLKWYANESGYVSTWANNEPKWLLHRFIINYTGPETIDHIDHNPLNNTKVNLRIVPQWQNSLNKSGLSSHNTSGVNGVSLTTHGKWEAYITINDKKRYLGLFSTREAALVARHNFECGMMQNLQWRDQPEHRKNNTSGVTGVSFVTQTNKWKAKINSRHLGFFQTKEEAITARKQAEQKI